MAHFRELSLQQYSSKGWTNCPFNARHEIPAEELDYHMSICVDKVDDVLLHFILMLLVFTCTCTSQYCPDQYFLHSDCLYGNFTDLNNFTETLQHQDRVHVT